MIDRRELRAFRVGGQLRVPRDSLVDLLRVGEVREADRLEQRLLAAVELSTDLSEPQPTSDD